MGTSWAGLLVGKIEQNVATLFWNIPSFNNQSTSYNILFVNYEV